MKAQDCGRLGEEIVAVTIAVSVALNGLRKANRFRKREVDIEHAPALSVAQPDIEPRLAQRLRGAIDSLSERCRTVFIMHDVEGFTQREVADLRARLSSLEASVAAQPPVPTVATQATSWAKAAGSPPLAGWKFRKLG